MKDNNEILPKKEISYECTECGWQSMVKPKGMKCPDYCRGTVYKCEFRHPNQSIEKGVKTADQFSRLPWYEQIKYIPVAGALCSTGFQELTDKQLETYKNSKVTAAIRYKPQPANNDYAVKESEWISVGDRLPIVDTDVFVCVQMNGFIDIQKDKFRLLDSYGEVKNWFHHYNVTHWMPMPALPAPPTIKPIKL